MKGFVIHILVLLCAVYSRVSAVVDPPTGVTVTAESETSLSVSWTAPTSCPSCTYKILYAITDSGDTPTEVNPATSPHSLDGLETATSYDIQVIAIDATPEDSTPATETASTSLAAPANVGASALSSTSITVTWTTQDVNAFKVEYRLTTETTWTTAAANIDGAAISYVINTGLNAGVTYNIQVTATKNGVDSDASAIISQATKPSTPSNVEASALSSVSITVTWDPQDADTFKVERSLTGQGGWIVAADDIDGALTSYVIAGLDAGIKYDIRVTATMNSVASEVSETIIQATNPAAPAGVTASTVADSTDSISVSWTAQPGVTFKVEYSVAGEDSYTTAADDIAIDTTTYEITALAAGTAYDVRVTAKKNDLESEAAETTEPASTHPDAPSNVGASAVSTTLITVTWDPQDVDTFKVEYTLGGQDTWTTAADGIDGTDTRYDIITGLAAGLNYQIRMTATKNSLESADSATITQATKPDTPAGVSAAVVDADSITVSWTSPAPDAEPESYKIVYQVSGASTATTIAGVTSPNQIDGLTANTEYTVQVIAVKHSVDSDPGTDTVTTAPGASGFTVSSVTTTTISVDIDEVTGSNINYKIYYTDKTDNTAEKLKESTTATATIGNLEPGHIYDIAVVVSVSNVDGERSGVITDSTQPLAPSISELRAADTTNMYVMWAPDSGSTQSSFKVTYKTPSGDEQTTVCGSQSADVDCTFDVSSEGNPGQEYEVSVIAVQLSRESASATDTGNTKPVAPGDLAVDSRSTSRLVIESRKPSNTVTDRYEVTVSPGGGTVTEDDTTNYYKAIIPDLIAGTEYTVTFYTVSGEEQSEHVTGSFYTKPAAPGAPSRESATTDSLTVTWAASDPANLDSYKVTLKETGSGDSIGQPVTVAHDATLTTTFDSGLIPGREYTVKVTAVVGAVESDTADTAMTIQPLPAENIAVKEATTSSLTVEWDAPSSSDYTGFEVSLPAVSGSEKTIGKSDTREAEYLNLSPGTSYEVVVSTRSDDQASEAATQSLYTLPNAPTDLAMTSVTTSTISVEWTVPVGNFDGYIITLKTSDSADVTATLADTETTYQFTGVLPAEAYEVFLKATVGSGAAESAEVNIEVHTQPNSPTGLQVTDRGTKFVEFEWNAPDSKTYTYIYTLTVSGEGTPAVTVSVSGTNTAKKTGLLDGTTYILNVVAIRNEVESDAASTTFTLIPDKPENFQVVNVGKEFLDVSWDRPPDGVVSGYELTWTEDGSDTTDSHTLTETSYKITGLTAETSYDLTVVAVSNDQKSGTRSLTQKTLPLSVGDITEESMTTTSVSISWSPPTSGTVEKYELRIDPEPAGTSVNYPVTIGASANREYTYMDLVPGETYTLSVDVFIDGQPVSVELAVTTKPSVVTNLAASTEGTDAVRVTWSVDSESTQTGFKVKYRPSSQADGGTEIHRGNSRRDALIDNLSPGGTYIFEVWAVSGTATGDSDDVTQTVKPLPVTLLTASPDAATDVTLTWEAGTGSTQDTYSIRSQGEYRDTSWSNPITITSPTKEYTFSDRIPGNDYTYEVTAISNDQSSEPEFTTAVQYPLPPSEVTIETAATTTTSVVVNWVYESDESYITKWRLEYTVKNTENWVEATTTSDENTLSHVVNNLISGQNYVMRVFGITATNLDSQTASQADATVKPRITTELTEGSDTSTNKVVIEYGPEDSDAGVFNKYIFVIDTTPGSTVENPHDEAERKVTFDQNIEAGHTYTITAHTVSGTEESDSINFQVTTNPNQPTLTCATLETSIRVNVAKPASGGVQQYEATCSSCPETDTQSADDNDGVSFTYTQLDSFKEYIFEVQSVFGGKKSETKQIRCTTQEAAPGAVASFTNDDPEPDEVTLRWTEPSVTNGQIQGYSLTYEGTYPIDRQDKPDDTGSVGPDVLEDTTFHYTVTGLKAGYTYTFTIRAKTSHADLGEPTDLIVLMPIGEPSCNGDCIAVEASIPDTEIKSKSVVVEFVNPFSDSHGDVERFSVIVSTERSPNAPSTLDKWAGTLDNVERTYAAIWECSGFFTEGDGCWDGSSRRKRAVGDPEKISVTIGGDNSCDKKKTADYCNGPLDPDTTYYFFLRGYTEGDKYTDTTVSSPVTTKQASSSGMDLIPIVAAVVVILLILVVVAVVVMLYRRGTFAKRDSSRHDGTSMRPVTGSRRPKSYVGETSRPVKVSEFSEHVRKMSADCDFRFAEEYESLKPVGMNQSLNAAELSENRAKNRFTNIKPYDQSRAKLLPTDDEDGSDYINASWMPGYNSKREFIVTQGPLPATRDDFWRLVWEQNCRAIIMLTKCVEKGRDKCDHYWPVDSEPMFYGDLQVASLNETRTAEWVVTEFKVSKGETSRKLRHFHYTVWPDFGVPERPQTLIRFSRLVRNYLTPDGGPIVVHCSAGVGRSGAFIAIDRSLQKINDRGDTIDVFGVVFEMRMYRRYMVQTEQQYVCIHKCIQCVVDGKEDDDNPYHGQVNEAYEVDEGIGN